MKKVTLKDIAAHTGFSPTTISVVLRGSEGIQISAETKAKIIEAAKELGYFSTPKPPKANQAERKKIAILVDAILHDDPFIASLQSMKEACWTHDHIPVIFDFHHNYELARIVLDDVKYGHYAGLIIATQRTGGLPSEMLEKINLPTVLLNCRTSHHRFTTVLPCDEKGGYLATQHLIQQGFSRIAHVTGDISSPASINRLRGFKSALADHDVLLNEEWISPGKWTVKDGYEAVLKMLEREPKPDAIFCSNDMSAVGAYFAFIEKQLKVPEDMAVIGYDDMLICEQLTPKLTTMSTPYRKMGQVGVERLLSEMAGLAKGPVVLQVEPELIIRNSTGR